MNDTQPPPGVSSGCPTPLEIQALARRYVAGGPGPKLTLMAVVENMGHFDPPDGAWWLECIPGRDRIATETEQHERTVRGHLARFEEHGILRRIERHAEHGGQLHTAYVMDAETVAVLRGVGVTPRGGGRPESTSGSSEHVRALTAPRGGGRDTHPSPPPPRTSVIASSEPAASRRGTPNPIWDAVVEVCGLHTDRMTVSEKSHVGKIVRELKAVEATPDQIREFGRWWRREHSGARLTPPTITKHWSARGTAADRTAAADYNPHTAWMYQ